LMFCNSRNSSPIPRNFKGTTTPSSASSATAAPIAAYLSDHFLKNYNLTTHMPKAT
jgi:hypothetical protein